jgi:hypothetical protein
MSITTKPSKVLVHGAFADATDWQKVIPLLAENWGRLSRSCARWCPILPRCPPDEAVAQKELLEL